jgi:hypothetical protein
VGWGSDSGADTAAADALASSATDGPAGHAPLLADTDTDTDASDLGAGEASRARQGRWSLLAGNGGPVASTGGWFKLRWWKRWRRDESDEDGDGERR